MLVRDGRVRKGLRALRIVRGSLMGTQGVRGRRLSPFPSRREEGEE